MTRTAEDAGDELRALFDETPESLAIYELDGVVRWANPTTERLFGKTLEEMRGRCLFELFPASVGNPFHQAFLRVATTGEAEVFDHFYAPFDAWFANRISRVGERIHVVARDITDDVRRRRRIEALARVSEVLTGGALEPASATHSVASIMTGVLDADCSLALLSDDGQWLELGPSVHREPVPAGVAAIRRFNASDGHPGLALRTRTSVLAQREDLVRTADGVADPKIRAAVAEYAPRSLLVVPLFVGEETIGVILAVRNGATPPLTEDDRALAEALAPSIGLYLARADLFEEAKHARSEAEAANRTKDEFLAILGHELRNPLAPIVTALELMRRKEPDRLVRERETIARQVTHVSRLVDDLLDVSRITRGKVQLRQEDMPLASAVARAMEMTRPLLERWRHHVTIDVPASVRVFADATRLGQVIANLLSNSAKYTMPGGRIVVRGWTHEGTARLSVRDDGIGIDPSLLPRVFDIFVQAPQESARSEGGLGIGLAIVRSLVQAHGGTVEARSEGVGRGAEILLTLPSASGAVATPEAARVDVVAPETSGRRVLVVDDSEDGALLLSELLRLEGHEVVTVHDGPAALRVAEGFAAEVAVLDLGLPVMDGYELAARLRDIRPVRLVAVTGYGRDTDRARTEAAGFDAHLAKPVVLEELLALISG